MKSKCQVPLELDARRPASRRSSEFPRSGEQLVLPGAKFAPNLPFRWSSPQVLLILGLGCKEKSEERSMKAPLCAAFKKLSAKGKKGKDLVMITVREALNRSYNLLGVGIIAICGLSFFSDLPAEINQPSHIVDEVLLAFLALVAFIWYLSGRNKYSRTVLPIVFAVLALAIKVLGLFLELSDPEDRGDEFGALVLFWVTIIVLVWQYLASRRLADSVQRTEQAADAALAK
jgi:hypothetical protein